MPALPPDPRMKLIGFWLLCLVAVLVPATASIATSMLCPEAFVAKAQERQQAKAGADGGTHRLAAAGGRHGVAKPVALAEKKNDKAGATAQSQALDEPCCDLNPCSHCISCGASASMIALDGPPAAPRSSAGMRIAGLTAPRAEFLLSGQERPPRSA